MIILLSLESSPNKPLILKSFSVWNDNMMLSFTPIKVTNNNIYILGVIC